MSLPGTPRHSECNLSERIRNPPTPAQLPARRDRDPAHRALVDQFIDRLRDGDGSGAVAVLEAAHQSGLAASAVISRVITPAMHAIGLLWQHGALSVADEHVATATCERAVAGLYPKLLTHRPRSRERMLVAAAEGETHVLAPRLVADILEGRGYEVVYLGADVPARALDEAVSLHKPELVALSLTISTGQALLARSIATVQAAQPSTLILLGGQGVAPSWRRRGFPMCDSAEAIPRMVAKLLAERPAMPRVLEACPEPASAPRTRDLAEHVSRIAHDFGALSRAQALEAAEYRFLALEDALTGLPNRRSFNMAIERAVHSAAPAVLIMVDVDGFKRINDTLGHAGGDRVLIEIGRLLADEVRPSDCVARIAGDEFAVLLNDAGEEQAQAVARRIRARVLNDLATIGATVSIGAASLTADRASSFIAADQALYQAKTDGRNTFVMAGSAVAAELA